MNSRICRPTHFHSIQLYIVLFHICRAGKVKCHFNLRINILRDFKNNGYILPRLFINVKAIIYEAIYKATITKSSIAYFLQFH